MEPFIKFLELAALLTTIGGIPAAIYIYIKEQRLLRAEREYGTYNALDDKYIELQQLCLDHPKLDIFDTPYKKPQILNEEQKKKEEAILLIRISIFERAFLMYQNAESQTKHNQWDGWSEEMQEWMTRENFLEVWKQHSPYYDKDFVEFINKLQSTSRT